MLLPQLLDGLDDLLVATLRTHRGRRIVRVAAGTVPIAACGLGVKGHVDAQPLADAEHEVPGHPHVVARLDALAGPNLVLPLPRHDLRIDARELDAGVEAGPGVRVRHGAPDRAVEACAAVVRALRGRVAHFGEAQGP